MITACLREAGVPDAEFSIVPFPIEVPQRLENYAPRDARYFLTVNDAWGDEKVRRLAGLGLNVDVLWRDENKAISGTMIRALMTSGGDWHHLVPPATAEFIERHGLAQRVAAQSVTG